MDREECLKREGDLNCAPRYYKAVNYNHDYNENTGIKKIIYLEKEKQRPTASLKKRKEERKNN